MGYTTSAVVMLSVEKICRLVIDSYPTDTDIWNEGVDPGKNERMGTEGMVPFAATVGP